MLFFVRGIRAVRRFFSGRPERIACAMWGAMAAMVVGLMLSTTAQADTRPVVSDELLRLHVLANSDSPADQQIKLKVRDAIQQQFAASWRDAPSGEVCRSWAQRDLKAIEACANQVLAEHGFAYQAKAQIGVYAFPDRVYEDVVALPAGRYWGVRILLGEAQGQNWWCVLYPPLCAGGEPKEDEPVEVRSWIWDNLPESWQRCLANFWIGQV